MKPIFKATCFFYHFRYRRGNYEERIKYFSSPNHYFTGDNGQKIYLGTSGSDNKKAITVNRYVVIGNWKKGAAGFCAAVLTVLWADSYVAGCLSKSRIVSDVKFSLSTSVRREVKGYSELLLLLCLFIYVYVQSN